MTFFGREEAGLLQRFRDGERVALEGVYRAYVDSVTRAVAGALRWYCRNGHQGVWREIATELPDLVQEVFTRAFEPEARRRFDGVREYGPYLTQIARNVVVDHLRLKWKELARNPELYIEQVSLHRAPNEEGDFGDLRIVALVGEYVSRLPPELRGVHEALYVQGLSQREAAASLGLGRQVVRRLESRLREGLRNALREIETLEVPGAIAAQARASSSSNEKVR